MKKTRRTSRVGENIRNALVEVLRHDVKGVDLGMTSITEVEVSPDLHYARVYMSGLEEEATRATVKELQKVAPRARHALGQRIHLRYTPELDFRYDETTMKASRIEALLYEINQKQAQVDAERASEEGPESEDEETLEDETPLDNEPRDEK